MQMAAPAEPELTLLEQQLMGCRTFRNEEIPAVDTTASLKVLDTYTPDQRRTAEQFAAAVSACTNFTCLQKANKLVGGGRGGGRWRGEWGTALPVPPHLCRCAPASLLA